jgi:hypothetical protein
MANPVSSVPPITHERNEQGGAFLMLRDGRRLGELLYAARGPGVVAVNHTEVDDSLRGSGAAKRLVEAVVLWARAENVKLVPRCSYVRAVLARTPAWQDVLAT